jgi:hypothetical protein
MGNWVLNNMKMHVEKKDLIIVEKTYHFNIVIDSYNYFIIVQTINIDGKETPISYKRGVSNWDCQKRLSVSKKIKMQRMIDLMF